MGQKLNHRGSHVLVLVLVWALVCLPNLGAPALWDIDEGNNAEAAYEMSESGTLIVPTFDYQMRVDKPALLYWLQIAAYSLFGVGEFAARLPSALAALAALLFTYELGRRTFGSTTGLLAGLILTSASLFCASARFANPDALLDACTVLVLLIFWRGYRAGRRLPFAAIGAVAGLGMLAKGPVGLVLPAAVSTVFLLWERQWRRLVDVRMLLGVLTFLLVAAPWYTCVGVETKGQWLTGFFVKHNLERAVSVMENHGGWFFYYAVVLLIGFTPWSIFFASAAWNARSEVPGRESSAIRFLASWIAVYFLFFTIVRTKLPNYILPTYPAIALLTARSLDRWRRRLIVLPAWIMPASLTCLALVGGGIGIGVLIAAGSLPFGVPTHRQLPALAGLAALGLLPIAAAVAGFWCLRRDYRGALVAIVASGAVLLTATLAALGPVVVDRYKAPRALSAALPADQISQEVRIASYEYFQPSLVFYCRREVNRLPTEAAAREFLDGPLPAFLFLPASIWDEWHERIAARELARHHDLYDGCDIVLVTNR